MSRFDYIKYDDVSLSLQSEAKQSFEAMAAAIETLPPGRAQALALTKLEEAYMWVWKAIRDAQVARSAATPLNESRDG